ncbi:septum formation initiator family protein [Candidatus Tachikawaea gelatinosa]|uniref:Cell division protein FtsB n=1 Tax=Candidatus Tachikawaea gelatinosa TaxID=1410383 RepID=A0A090AQB1_9ENTR|nr:septum formation initiator family protein [Candidatus Tachikawaea gelatinosa]BAP58537.1 cell division protein FtsB [Candidatus Tachikawaea gelatinosa]
MFIKKLVAILLIAWLQYSLWFGKNGIHDYNKIKKKMTQKKIENIMLKQKRKSLEQELEDIKNNYK